MALVCSSRQPWSLYGDSVSPSVGKGVRRNELLALPVVSVLLGTVAPRHAEALPRGVTAHFQATLAAAAPPPQVSLLLSTAWKSWLVTPPLARCYLTCSPRSPCISWTDLSFYIFNARIPVALLTLCSLF